MTSLRSRRLIHGMKDTDAMIAARIRDRALREQAVAERIKRWPELTEANAREAIEWQTARIRELLDDDARAMID